MSLSCKKPRIPLISRSPPTTQPAIKLRLGLDWEVASSLAGIVPWPAHSKTTLTYSIAYMRPAGWLRARSRCMATCHGGTCRRLWPPCRSCQRSWRPRSRRPSRQVACPGLHEHKNIHAQHTCKHAQNAHSMPTHVHARTHACMQACTQASKQARMCLLVRRHTCTLTQGIVCVWIKSFPCSRMHTDTQTRAHAHTFDNVLLHQGSAVPDA